tara:strand:- start:5177 stop:5359 length:183 start_codon:yes stop_codon:yes gene_type:complete
MDRVFEDIKKFGKWEDYLKMELECGTPIEDIYNIFWWGGDICVSYHDWLMRNVKELCICI